VRLIPTPDLGAIRRRPTIIIAVVVTLVVAGLTAAQETAAFAETTPTSIQLLQKCDNGADYCVFHVAGAAEDFWETEEIVGQTANCTYGIQDASISWTKSAFSSNSIGTSLKFIAGASKAFLNGFKIAYSHEWTESTTNSDTTKISIPPRSMGRVYHSNEMEHVSGQFELHFKKRFHDHYYWYVPMTETSPVTTGTGNVTTKSTPLTADERAAYCP
jgi:hypothetical protein